MGWVSHTGASNGDTGLVRDFHPAITVEETASHTINMDGLVRHCHVSVMGLSMKRSESEVLDKMSLFIGIGDCYPSRHPNHVNDLLVFWPVFGVL